jgi:hypothetical protein
MQGFLVVVRLGDDARGLRWQRRGSETVVGDRP